MKAYFQILLTALFISGIINACSSDSEDPAPEPDKTAPTVDFNIAGVSNNTGTGPVVVSGEIVVNVSAQDSGGVAKVEAYIDDQKVGEDITAPFQIIIDISGYTSKIAQTAKFKDHVLKIVVTDTSGNSSSKEEIINIDNEIPSITEVSLQEGQIIGGDINTVTFSVADNEEIASVKTYLNEELLSEILDGTFEVNLNTLGLTDGENTLKIEAADLAENIVIHEIAFISDNTGPNITLESPGEVLYQETTILPEVSDNISKIQSVEILFGEESLAILENPDVLSYQLSPDELPVGPNYLIIKATDEAFNESKMEIPVTIHRKLITINLPLNFLQPFFEELYVFASSMDGKTLDVEEVFDGTQQIVLSTDMDIDFDTEFMLTFGSYSINDHGTSSAFSTLQNLKPSFDEMNLRTIPKLVYEGFTEIPCPLSNGTNGISISARGFGYSGSGTSMEKFNLGKYRNISNSVKTDVIYISLFEAWSDFAYTLLDYELPADLILDEGVFTTEGINKKSYTPILHDGGTIQSSKISLFGYFNQDDFQNNVFHTLVSSGYGWAPPEGIPYYTNSIFEKYRYEISINDYFTARTGYPLESFTSKDWSIDFSQSNKEINLIKNGTGHHVGKVSMHSEWPIPMVDGKEAAYQWVLVFDSEKMDKVIIPELPEELKSWGFYQLYDEKEMTAYQVEIKGYEGITSYSDYYEKILKNNKLPYTVSPVIESKFKHIDEIGFPYVRLNPFFLFLD